MNHPIKRFYESPSGTIALASLASWLYSLQLLIIVVFIAGFFKIDTTTVSQIFTSRFPEVHVERESEFYRFYVIVSFLIQGGLLWLLRRKLDDQQIRGWLKFLIGVNAFWILVQLFFVFKCIIYQSPGWAKFGFYASMALAVVSQVFAFELRYKVLPLVQRMLSGSFPSMCFKGLDVVGVVTIGLIMWMPDASQALAVIFAQTNFNSWDPMIMAPGWVFLHAGTLNVDQTSPFGPIIPAAIALLAKATGGFDYGHVLNVVVAISLLYFIVLNMFLRAWLGSRMLALAGTLVAVKLQLFSLNASPLVWCTPQNTVLRHLLDAAFFGCLFLNIGKPSKRYLAAAVILCGSSLAMTPDTGLGLLGAYYLYLVLFSRGEKLAHIRRWMALAAAPFVVALAAVLIFQGSQALSSTYWLHFKEYLYQIADGFFAVPIADALRNRQFFAFFMGLIIPVIYVMTICVTGFLTAMKAMERENMFVIPIAVYGLIVHHDFIVRSLPGAYYIYATPLVMVVCFWVREWLISAGLISNRMTMRLLALGAALSFLTNPWFTIYPNVFNLDGYTFDREKEYYQKEFRFGQDAAMIKRLTLPEDFVVVISSFETPILMTAGRKPLLYDFPLFESAGIRLNHFAGTRIFTHERFDRTIARLNNVRPERIFVERKLWQGQIAKEYYQYHTALTQLIMFLQPQYEIEETGEFLLSLKRKPSGTKTP